MSLVDYYEMRHKVHLAKLALIKARIARQQATIAKEFDMYCGDGFTSVDDAQALLDEAKALRLEAQELLRKVERLNGERFLVGKTTYPLMHYLKGSFFKAWKEFDAEYAKLGAPFFGSDPE